MVDKTKRRSRSSSSSSSGSSSGSSSSGSGSSSSSSSASRSPTPKKTRTAVRDERSHRRSPRRSRSRSPRRVHPKTEKTTVSSSRRSPSPAVRRRSPSPARHRRSPSPRRRQISPIRHRSRSPRRSPRRERPAVSPIRERRERTPEPPPRRLCVRNLSRNVSKAHLEEIFALFGMIKACELPMDRMHTHLTRGYGYVEYDKAEDAEKALKHMDGGQIDGQEIQCEMTLPFRAGRGNSPPGAFAGSVGIKRERSRSPRRAGGGGGRSPPRRARSPLPPRGTGANQIPLGTNGRYRSPARR